MKDSKTTGEAVVLLANIANCELALQRDHQHMGRRYVEVFQAKRADYYLAASLRLKSEQMYPTASGHLIGHGAGGYGPPQQRAPPRTIPTEHTGVIRMRGLPFSVTVDDIFHFFRGNSFPHHYRQLSFPSSTSILVSQYSSPYQHSCLHFLFILPY